MLVLRALGVALASLAVLAACGGGGQGAASDPTVLPHDPTGPGSGGDSPASGGLVEQESPQRFIRRWAAAEARMEHGGPAAPYLRLSATCPACSQLARTVARYYRAGGFVRGGDWRIDSIKSVGSASGYPLYRIRAHTSPSTVRESSSSPVQHVPAGPVTYEVGLLAKGSSYTVTSRTRGP